MESPLPPNPEPRDLKLRSIKEVGALMRQNPLFAGAYYGILGFCTVVSVVQSIFLVKLMAQTNEPDETVDILLQEKNDFKRQMIEEMEAMKDLYTPCTRTDQKDFEVAQSWLLGHTAEIQKDALLACATYPDCPIKSEEAEAGFLDSFSANMNTTQFFCPTFDKFSTDGGAIDLASTNVDQDQDRILQIFMRQELLEAARVNPCELVRVEVHESIHAAANVRHDKTSPDYKMDWPYYMGIRVYRDCVKNPPAEWTGRIPANAAPY